MPYGPLASTAASRTRRTWNERDGGPSGFAALAHAARDAYLDSIAPADGPYDIDLGSVTAADAAYNAYLGPIIPTDAGAVHPGDRQWELLRAW